MSSSTQQNLARDLKHKKALLASRLKAAAELGPGAPLSFAQQRLWFLDQLQPDTSLYNVPAGVRLKGQLDTPALQRALNRLLDRHEALRTRFVCPDEDPVQTIAPSEGLPMVSRDLSSLSEAERREEFESCTRKEISKPFALARDLPIRALLLRFSAQEHVLLLTTHHIISDEWSLKVLFRDLVELYQSECENRVAKLPRLPIQYRHYASWQRDYLKNGVVEKQLAYWKQQLADAPFTQMPVDGQRQPEPSFKGACARRMLSAELTKATKTFAASQNSTFFMVLLAALKAVIARYAGTGDVIVGSPIAGRTRVETEDLVGFFVNTLPLRTRFDIEQPFSDLLAKVRSTTLDAYTYQEVPFDKIVEAVRPERSLSHLPFSSVMFVLQHNVLERLQSPGLSWEFFDPDGDTAKFELTLVLRDTPQGLEAKAEYNTDLFQAGTIARLLGHFETLLAGAVASPHTPVADLPLLTSEEVQQLRSWNNTTTSFPRHKCIHELFEAQAERSPDTIAVSYGDTQLSYAELSHRSNQLAHLLKTYGVGPDVPVGLCVQRSLDMVVAMLGILKAGGAYVPLDPGYPKSRLLFMLEDTHPPVVLTQQKFLPVLPRNGAKVISLDADWELIARESRQPLANATSPSGLAYIMYTSGSTGVPKGVAVTHLGVTRLVLQTNYIELSANDRIAQVSNISFDAATFEVWGALLNGGQLVGITRSVTLSPSEFASELKERGITAIFLTSALFNQVASEAPGAFATLDTVLTGGEVMDIKWVRSVLLNRPPKRLVNVYGPTENTTFTSFHPVTRVEESTSVVPIGRPIANTTIHILDSRLRPVPVGVPGELYTGGDGVARGYWQRPPLTAEKFVPDPFDVKGKLYRTGDLARWLPDGAVEFLGRIDQQVKLRGFRIELTEIEMVLGTHPQVRSCAVTVHGTSAETRRLVAYVVPQGSKAPSSSELRSYLSSKLPDFMVPGTYLALPSLPITPNGKVDRKALPVPDQVRPDMDRVYLGPRDEVECKLVEIWEGVLGVKPVGVRDKFFDLGGHSLLAVRVITRIEKEFGRRLRLATVFQRPTIEQIGEILRNEAAESFGNGASSLVELQGKGNQLPLFLVHGAGGGMFWGYVNLVKHIGKTQPVFAFRSRGLDGREELSSIEELAAQYVHDLRAVQPHGPYHLGGYCFGGNVAFEMARQLEQQGEQVAHLALFNCAPPNSGYTNFSFTPLWAARFARNLVYWANYCRQWSPSQRREFVRWKWNVLKKRVNRWFGKGEEAQAVDTGNLVDLSSYSAEQRKIWEAHIRALAAFKPKSYTGPITLYRSPGHPLWCSFEPDYGWGALTSAGVTVKVVPGAHEKILEDPCVKIVANEVRTALAGRELESRTSSQPKQGEMAVFQGVVLRAALLWIGLEGEALLLQEHGLSSGLSLGMLMHHIGALSSSGKRDRNQNNGSNSDFAEPAMQDSPLAAGLERESVSIPEATSQALAKLAEEQSLSPVCALIAVSKALFQRYEHDGDISPVLMPLSGSDQSEGVVKCEMNRLLMGVNTHEEITFREILKALAGAASQKGSVQNGTLPVVRLRFAAHESAEEPQLPLDLCLQISQTESEARFEAVYNSKRFDSASAARAMGNFLTLAQACAEQPDQPISKLPVLSPAERQQVLVDWNDNHQDFGVAGDYIHHFHKSLRAHRQSPAVVSQEGVLTYAELDERSNRLAHYLKTLGAGPETLVGVCLPRSFDLITSLLAVWKSGAAYLPLDPGYPEDRLAYMLKDAQARILITTQDFLRLFQNRPEHTVCLDRAQTKALISSMGAGCLKPEEPVDRLAYVIYTSGSTGTPKGVEITHRALLNHNFGAAGVYNLVPEDRILQFTPVSFDISVEEIFPTLLTGAALMLRTEESIASVQNFFRFVEENRITVLNIPTAYWHEIVDLLEELPLPGCVRMVVIGGEKASDEAFRRWNTIIKGRVALVNSYGPTEATVTSTAFRAEPGQQGLTIGRPFPNTQVLILDRHLQPVPIGVAGELCIGGASLARGYLRRPELTEQKFVSNPWKSEVPSDRLYRTGDLARFRPDGNIEFLGRLDQQVKIRGYRIELGEIESALESHPQVKNAVVIAREDVPGQKRLVAYIVPRSGTELRTSDLLKYLRKSIPAYMVPAAFVAMAEFPMTPAGKVDRRNLPEPGHSRPELDQTYVAPRNPLEAAMAQIWSEVLGVDRVGIHDNFFDLGGHSLLAGQLLARARERLGLEIVLGQLLSHPTIADLLEDLPDAEAAQEYLRMSSIKGEQRELTFAQKRTWFLDSFDPKTSPYNLGYIVRLRGPLHPEALQESLKELYTRHEPLRSVYPVLRSQAVQLILDQVDVDLAIRDLSGLAHEVREAQACAFAREETRSRHIFTSPLLKVRLLRLDYEEHWLLLVLNEVGADDQSARYLIREWLDGYQAVLRNDKLRLPEVSYTELQARLRRSAENSRDEDIAYWTRDLEGVPTALELPLDFPRPRHRTDEGAQVDFQIGHALRSRIEALAKRLKVTPEDVLLAGYSAVLAKYSRSEDFVIGCTSSQRPADPVGAVGNFTNWIPLRFCFRQPLSFAEVVSKTRRRLAEGRRHGKLSLASLLEILQTPREPSHTPLFQVAFSYEEQALPAGSLAGLNYATDRVNAGTAKLDLELRIVHHSSAWQASLVYSPDLFTQERIQAMIEHLRTYLENALNEPATALLKLPMLPKHEMESVLGLGRGPELDALNGRTIVELFQAVVERAPGSTALVSGNARLTYRELNSFVDNLAAELVREGIKPGALVGVCLPRSWEMVAALLAILKCGAAYVPMDPAYPRERLALIAESCKAAFILTQAGVRERLPTQTARAVFVDELDWKRADRSRPAACPAKEADLAYVIYTSGSTGTPKGVAIEHRNVVAFIAWAQSVFGAQDLDGVLASTSICFDLSVFEIFVPLCSGGKVILAENALALPGLPAAREVVLVNTVPSAMRELLGIHGIPRTVKVVNLAGEPLATSLVDRIYSETNVSRVYDLYGPTETTTYSTFVLRQAGRAATIGRPLANEEILLLDKQGHLTPIGVPGEVHIGGVGIARGYLHQPDLTNERFVPHPMRQGERIYRTGDLARWRQDGELEYLGRLDHQVKLRGFRIELGEVESVLRKVPGVREAVALVREDQPGDSRLVGYVEPGDGTGVCAESCKAFLRERLPEYMVPSHLLILPKLPLTPNGKVNKKALPAPDTTPAHSETAQALSPLEEQVAKIFCEVLNTRSIGLADNFFELGGHSLLAIRVVARIREVLQVEVPLYAVFEAPTVDSLSQGLSSGAWTENRRPIVPLRKADREIAIPLSYVQERLWFLDQLHPGDAGYNIPVALRLRGAIDNVAMERALQIVIGRHEALRTTLEYDESVSGLVQRIQPPGPFKLAVHELPGETTAETKLQETLNQRAREAFDLAAGPLIRADLYRLAETDCLLLLVMHHTVSDGWSVGILLHELELLYEQLVSGQTNPELPKLEFQYADYSVWQRQTLDEGALRQEMDFWKAKLAGAPDAITFPLTATEGAPAAGNTKSLVLPAELEAAFGNLCQQHGCTTFMGLLTALGMALRQWTGQEDMVLGTVVAGRGRKEVEEIIGCFMNFLPVRLQYTSGSVSEALKATRGAVLEAQAHQDCPFEKMVEAVNPERRQDRNPLYNVALLLQNFPAEPFKAEGVNVTTVPVSLETSLLDLRFEAEKTAEGFKINCEYRTDLFASATIDQFLASFLEGLTFMVGSVDSDLRDFPMAEELKSAAREARAQAVAQNLVLAATFTAEPLEEPLRHWFEELQIPVRIEFAPYNQVFQQLLDPGSAVARNPEGLNVLLVRLEDWTRNAGQNGNGSLTELVNEFTGALSRIAGRTSSPILVVTCPPSNPAGGELEEAERLFCQNVLATPGVYLLTSQEVASWYPVQTIHDSAAEELGLVPYTEVYFTALATAITRKFHALKRPPFKVIALDCDNTLWCGVCGEDGPDGIRIGPERRALQEFMRRQHEAGMLLCLCSKNNEEDVQEVFARRLEMPLHHDHFVGRKLNWRPKSENLKELARELNLGLDSFIFVDDNPVECAEVEANAPGVLALQIPADPSAVPQFLEHCWAFDHLKVTAEDRLRAESYRQNAQRERLRAESMSLTDFLTNLGLEIAIDSLEPANLARASQLTLRTNQFNFTTIRRSEAEIRQVQSSGQVLTVHVRDKFGDYGLVGLMIYQMESGILHVDTFLLSCRVLGRGVEHRMLAHLGDIARSQGASTVRAKLIRSAKNKPAMDFLNSVGSAFMKPIEGGFQFDMPAGFASEVVLSSQPAEVPESNSSESAAKPRASTRANVLQSGSLHRRVALGSQNAQDIHARFGQKRLTRHPGRSTQVPPRTPLQTSLVNLWKELLKTNEVGIQDNFFDLGGHSLLAVRLFAEIAKMTGKKLPLITLFSAGTIEELATLLGEGSEQGNSLLVPIQPNGNKPALFLVHGAGGDVLWGYANLAKCLPPDQPIYGLKSRGQLGQEEYKTIEEMAAGYIKAIREFQPEGPYHLGGYCFGGNVAYEMARQLKAQGQGIALLAMIDSAPSNAGYERIPWWRPSYAIKFVRNFSLWLRDFAGLPARDRRQFVLRKSRSLWRKLVSRVTGKPSTEVDLEEVIDPGHFPENELRLWQVHLDALVAHKDQPYDGEVILLRTRGQPLFCSLDEDFSWGPLAPRLQVVIVPGAHESVFVEPHVRELAAEVEKRLRRDVAPPQRRSPAPMSG